MCKAIFAAVTILMLAAMSTSVFAFEYGDPAKTGDTQWEKFGPRADELLIKLYASEISEWDAGVALREIDVTDWPLDAAHYATFNADPDLKVISYGAEFGLFLFDLNNNNNEYLGNPPDPLGDANPVYPNPMSVLALRKAVAYLSDRDYIVNTLLGTGFGYPLYTPMSPASGFYVHPDINPLGSRSDLCYLYSIASANAVLDASLEFPMGVDGWRYWDKNLNGVKDLGEELSLKLVARSDSAVRFGAAQKLKVDLEDGTKIHVNWIPGDKSFCSNLVMALKDFHIYTGGWSLGMDPDHLILWHWDYYWHPGKPYNYAGCNNADYNDAADDVQYANTIEEATEAAHRAQLVYAEDVLSVPLYSTAGSKVVSRTYVGNEDSHHGKCWRNFVNIPGFGVDNGYTFMNMRPTTVTRGGTIRYGFSTTSISSLNPLFSASTSDNKVLDLIGYESLLAREPYTRMLFPWLCDSYQIGTYDDGYGNMLTNITFVVRRSAYWSDGTPITVDDIEYTFTRMHDDLAARGIPPVWWASNVNNVVDIIRHSDTKFEIRLDVKSVYAVSWIGLNRILPKHIWQPICTGATAPKSGLPWDPTTFAPDPDMIHSGPWCLADYVPNSYILLEAHKRGGTYNTGITADPNKDAEDITSPYGFFRYYRDEDINKDDKVDSIDANILAEAYGAVEGDPRYSRHIDITGDGRINQLDVIVLGIYFGWPNGELAEDWHDIAVTDVKPSKTVVGQGDSMSINVTVENQGNFPENTVVDLFLSVYANTTLLESQPIPYLAPLTATTLSFSWNTTGYLTGPYKVTAIARRVPYEADIADNDRTYGMIKVQTANMHVLSVFNNPPLSVLLPFTINQTRSVAPWNGNLTEGTYAVSMPATIVEEGIIYKFKNWENNLTSPTRTISLTNDSEVTAYYEASSAPQPTVYASPRVTTKAPDTSFPIDLCIANVTNLHSWEIELYYDTRFMSALTATEGPFLKSSGTTNFQVKELNDAYNATHGRVILASALTEPSSSISGNGTLATVTLGTTAIGNSDLYFGQTKLADPALTPISHILLQGISLIRVSVPGDINNDGIVNILDAILLSASFGLRPADSKWNTNANLNTDSVINILDCIILSNYFGKTEL